MAALYKATIRMHALGSEAHASNIGINASVAHMWDLVRRNKKREKGNSKNFLDGTKKMALLKRRAV
tara:strand:+ start:384 stop:581 length:198 start_codon:yes stop_codon:yes gene_type:complete